MMHNLLENWKKECYLLSSNLSLNKQLERKDVDSIYQIFLDYFGLDYFKIETSEPTPYTKSNWLHSLLVNHKRPACIAALYETANMILYLQTLSKSIQKKFKSLYTDTRQFRDLFFELYVFRFLDYNKIPNTKKPKEGNQELDIVCTINEKEFLCECMKLYTPGFNLLEAENYFMERLYFKLGSTNKVFGLIGTIKFTNPNDIKVKEIFESKLTKFFEGFIEQNFNTINYHDIDENGELTVINYSDANNIEIEKNLSHYHLVFKIIPPFNLIPGTPTHCCIELQAGFSFPQTKVTNKLFDTIKGKYAQHANSKYINKIYFVDSETIPDFQLPIFRMDSMFEEEKIKEYINLLPENEIVCFIRREYMDDIPKVSIKAFGKNIDEKVKQRLESLKTNFDYRIIIKHKKTI